MTIEFADGFQTKIVHLHNVSRQLTKRQPSIFKTPGDEPTADSLLARYRGKGERFAYCSPCRRARYLPKEIADKL